MTAGSNRKGAPLMSFSRTPSGRLVFWVAVSLLLPLEHAASQDRGDPQPPLAFVGVNVIPLAGSTAVLPDYTVIVRDGRIAAMGPSSRVAVPGNAVRIASDGRYLMPGLADMHVHLEHFDDPGYLQLFLVNGITSVRSMDGRPNILDWKRRADAGALPSPAIYTAGQVIDGDPPVRDDNRVVRTADEARGAVAEQASEGYDFIKIYANLSPDAFRAIMAAARARRLPVAGHIPDAVPLDEFLAAGMASIEHLGDYANAIQAGDPMPQGGRDPARRRLDLQVDSSRAAALASRLARSGAWVVPTMILSDRAVAPPDVLRRWMSDPEVAVIDRGILQYYWEAGVTRAAQRLDAEGWRLVERGRLNRIALVDAFRRAGVPMLVGTDTPQPFVFPGASVHDELANFVAAGFTPEGALIAATRDAARFMGQERLWGTVEPGKRADLLLLEANPLQDIGTTRRIAGVVAQGRWFPASRLQEMRASVERLAAASN
jgi:imidazolonepropionase-like amidohydrolase